MEKENRPWGGYEVLIDELGYKVKRLVVKSGKRCSYQAHHRRAEHWFVVQGTATATVDDKEITLKAGDSIDIPIGVKHRICGTGDNETILIEVQTGTYFGEDDIVRFEDDFGREKKD